MSNLRITGPAPTDWTLAQHITEPRPAWWELGRPRQYAPPPDILETDTGPEPELLERANQPHPKYVGVYLESRKPRRYYYRVPVHGRDVVGYGFPSPAMAAKTYDRVCRQFGVNLDLLNFPTEQEASA